MTPDRAETIALRALAWLVSNDELLPVFLGATGADLAGLKAGADQPALQIAVLDFICMDDAWVRSFCTAADLPPDTPFQARQALPGGASVHWT